MLRVSRAGATSRSHPTQKPVELLAQLIEMSSDQGELVFDPFMGTGAPVSRPSWKIAGPSVLKSSDGTVR